MKDKTQLTFCIDSELMRKFKLISIIKKSSMTRLLLDYVKKICDEYNTNDMNSITNETKGVTNEMQSLR